MAKTRKKRINYKKLMSSIPHVIDLCGHRYEIVFVKDFLDGNTSGEAIKREGLNQIRIKLTNDYKDMFHTFAHELTHAVGFETGAEYTEKQVLQTEQAVESLLRLFFEMGENLNASQNKKTKATKE